MEKFDTRERGGLPVEYEDTAKAVGVVRVGSQVLAGLLWRGWRRLAFEAKPIFCQVLANRPCPRSARYVLRLHRGRSCASSAWASGIVRRHADIAADLADPHGLATVAHRAEPEPQVIALVDGVARLLQCEVLRPPEQIEIAHGCIDVALAGKCGRDDVFMIGPDHLCSVGLQPRLTRAGNASSRPPTITRLSGSPFFAPSSLVAQHGRFERRAQGAVVVWSTIWSRRIDLTAKHRANVVIRVKAGHHHEEGKCWCPTACDKIELE